MRQPFDLCIPLLERFSVDAVDRWFTEDEVEDVVAFVNGMAFSNDQKGQ